MVSYFLDHVDWLGNRLGLNVPTIVDIESLERLPKGTLGRSLVDLLQREQLSPLTTGPRRKQLHDSVHVLTGYGTDPIGEAEVQAFLLGAKFHPIQIVLGLGLLVMAQRRVSPPHSFLWQRLQNAYQRGQRSTFDVDRWQPETQWHLPITEVQAVFHL
jgi:ubiquinone biosynthesis protein Coq4